MTILLISGGLLGAVLGLRFKVLVLLPVMLLGALTAGCVLLIQGGGVASTAVALIGWAVALQAGYFMGLVTRFVVAGQRAPRTEADRVSLARTSR